MFMQISNCKLTRQKNGATNKMDAVIFFSNCFS